MDGRRGPLVIVPRRVADRFTAEIRAHPHIEVGGKYVGFIRGASRYKSLVERKNALSGLVFHVTDYLDDGPNAERTGGFHRGDADWQTQEFRRLEQQNPDLEQLGSWHSHHPNGMGTLSSGDIHGYMATVNDRGHNHDFFFVSLGVDRSGFASARHYLFVREDSVFYELTVDNVRVAKDEPVRPAGNAGQQEPAAAQPSNPAPASDAAQHGTMHDGAAAQNHPAQVPEKTMTPDKTAPDKTAPDQTAPDNQASGNQWEHKPAEYRQAEYRAAEMSSSGTPEMRSSGPAGSHEAGRQLLLPGWSDTSRGRKMLAQEKDILRDHAFAGIRLSVVQGRLMAKGPMRSDKDSVTISLLYPSTPDSHDGLLKIATTTPPEIQVSIPGELSAGLLEAAALVNEFLRFTRAICQTDSFGRRVLKQFRGRP